MERARVSARIRELSSHVVGNSDFILSQLSEKWLHDPLGKEWMNWVSGSREFMQKAV